MLSFTLGCVLAYCCTPGRRVESTHTVIGEPLTCLAAWKVDGPAAAAWSGLLAVPQALRAAPASAASTATDAHLALRGRDVPMFRIDQHLSGLILTDFDGQLVSGSKAGLARARRRLRRRGAGQPGSRGP